MDLQYRTFPSARYVTSTLNKKYFLFMVLLFMVVDSLCTDYPSVSTKWGCIYGKWSRSLRDQPIANFLGIPYALPPLGDLRFSNPQRWNRTWTTFYNGRFDKEKCIQLDQDMKIIGNEDCLYLNVFVPHFSDPSQKHLPVLVMVHGGGYLKGSSDSKLLAPDYLMDQKVILVTLNYRLGALGFFSTGNKISPGNYALKDVQMALRWIQENIHNFKGDPGSVTLMGHSAGAAIVHLLVLSRKTEGLFHRYILQSGSALGLWSYYSGSACRQICLKLARRVGCLPKMHDDVITSNETDTVETPAENYTAEDDEEMVKCMRRIDAGEIINMTRLFHLWRGNPISIFRPTLEDDSEDAVLTMYPWQIVKAGLFRDIPAIIQMVADEGLFKSIIFWKDDKAENELLENLEKYLPALLEFKISNISDFIDSIEDFYFDGNITLNFRNNITELLSDAIITWMMHKTVEYHSKTGNSSIYLSLFAYEGTFTMTFSSGIPIHYGIAHGDDLNYLFPILNNRFQNYMLHNTENDITMINIMTEMWANFAKTGVPSAWMIPAWPDYRDHHQFMRFGIDTSPDIVVQTDFPSDRIEFWEKLIANQLLPELMNSSVPDPPETVGSANTVGCGLIVHSIFIIYFLLSINYLFFCL